MSKYTVLYLLVFSALKGNGQELIPLGTWRTHFNYQDVHLIEEVNDKIYAATDQALLYYDRQDNSLNKVTKLDGLNDSGISALSFSSNENAIAIGYQNGNIDVITADGVINIPVIKNSGVVESKAIRYLEFYQGRLVASTAFGVLEIDVNSGEVVNAFRNLGPSGGVTGVNEVDFLNDLMFLASDSGLMMANRAENLNFQDFNNWQRLGSAILHERPVEIVQVLNDAVYTVVNDSLLRLEDEELTLVRVFDSEISSINTSANRLILLLENDIVLMDEAQNFTVQLLPSGDQPNEALVATNGEIWYTDEEMGLTALNGNQATRFVLPGPSTQSDQLLYINDQILAFPTLVDTSDLSLAKGYSVFDLGNWTNVEPEQIESFGNLTGLVGSDEEVFFSSFGHGVLELSSGVTYDASNSTLPSIQGNVLATGLILDQANNVWVSAVGFNPLHKRNTDGEWQSYSFAGVPDQFPTQLHMSRRGNIWMPLGENSGQGVVYFNPEEGISRWITADNTSLNSNRINDVGFGWDGEVWLATNQGVALFDSDFAAEDNRDVILPIIDGNFLLEGVSVSCLAVDPGNRKWMGTDEGLWLFEDAGEDLIYHFTTENSPLPSNYILDLEIDPQTGEIFIATNQGVVSYRSEATTRNAEHREVSIFPNPVRPGYQGLVGVNGLVSDATLKITSVSGRLVREVHSAGGGASWDLSDYNGRRVTSGVYLIFSSDEQGSETFVGKIAVLE